MKPFGGIEEDTEDRWTFQIGNEIGLVETNQQKSSTWLVKQQQGSKTRGLTLKEVAPERDQRKVY